MRPQVGLGGGVGGHKISTEISWVELFVLYSSFSYYYSYYCSSQQTDNKGPKNNKVSP